MHDLLVWLTTWSPYIWLFGSIFGVFLSGTLFHRSMRAFYKLEDEPAYDTRSLRYWRRHAAWFLVLHASYVVVGFLSIAEIEDDWASFIVLTVLLATPLILVYRSWDSLVFNRRHD